jgi:hypothetical protein
LNLLKLSSLLQSWIRTQLLLKVRSLVQDDLQLSANKTIAGYKEFKTGRKYMALMGDWRNNKDEEIALDGVGGVSILVKADVHRSGALQHGGHALSLSVFWLT